MEVAVGSELGVWQKQNHDAYLTESLAPSITFFAVADGFGMVGRNVAAAPFALAAVRDFLRRKQRLGALGGRDASPSNIRQVLLAALSHANARLYAQGGSHDDFVGSGSSVTAVLVVGQHAFIGHVGDARAYLLRCDRLETLTADDAISTESVTTSKTAVPARPQVRSLLWRTLGTQPKLEASIAHIELLPGDQLILCTDGIHRSVYAEDFIEVLSSGESTSDGLARLLLLAKTRGSLDNGTLIIGRDLLTPAVDVRTTSDAVGDRIRVVLVAIAIALALAALIAVLYSHLGSDERHSSHTAIRTLADLLV